MRYFVLSETQYGPDGRRMFNLGEEILAAETVTALADVFLWEMERNDAIKHWSPSLVRRFAKTAWRDGRADTAIGRRREHTMELGEVTENEARDAAPDMLRNIGTI